MGRGQLHLHVFTSEGNSIGGGHVARQLVVCEEAARKGFRATFYGALTQRSRGRLAKLGADFVQLAPSANVALGALREVARHRASNSVVVIDQYSLLPLLSDLTDLRTKMVIFSDGQSDLKGSVFLQVDSALYNPHEVSPLLQAQNRLFGPQAAVISSELQTMRSTQSPVLSRPLSGLGSFGLSDPKDASHQLFSLWSRRVNWPALEIVLGPLYKGALPSLAPVKSNVQIGGHGRLAPLLNTASFAIGASGLSSYERAFLGLPSILLPQAQNQEGIARILSDAGAAMVLESFDEISALEEAVEKLLDAELRGKMSQAGLDLVNAKAVSTILTLLETRLRE